ncbi:hypothetical protein HS088_TW18G00555 [Tripterygium wilfordii]|uniref:Myb-like protein X n=1 Tax=Tripterygium wilfordii TaxID=458696 RepID=A0A7J7CCQ6_TRIWF|nr:uncharacterized protein DDB_G0283697-like [Tripterygium wilfordii]KAF5731870.1 hypothetical protein HS088_TW18G00555 [Tripterygium wilfordii]
MLKRSPGRTQRPKGIKIKHVLQILFLLGVCFWLIYQIKHSHDKKEEYDEKESKVSVGTQTGVENFKLGRKDLPREEVTRSEKPDEEEEEESRGDDEEIKHVEEEQEENRHEEENKHKELKHEEDEQEELDNKGVAVEDEGNGGGEDEINERDQEKIEETEHDDEFMDEEKERANGVDEEGRGREGEDKERENGDDEEGGGREGEDKERDIENENSSDDQDLDGGNLNNHEAREEHYKADDASSAVSHDIQTMGSESQKGTLEDQKQNSEREVLQQENQSNNMIKDTDVHENSRLTVGEGDKAVNGTSLVLESSVRKDDESSTTERGDNSVSNSTLISTSDNQPVGGNTSLEMSTEASKNSGSSVDSSGSAMQITETMNLTQAQNATSGNVTIGGVSNLQTVELEQANNSTSISDRKQSDSTVPTGIENADATASNSSNWESNIPDDIVTETTTGSEINSGSSLTTKENPDASQNEKLDPNNEPGGIDEDSGPSAVNGTADAIQHETIDSSDSLLVQDIKDTRLDLDTLPDITTRENNIEDAAAE